MQKGSLVICVDDANWCADAHLWVEKLPVKGKVYQVRKMMKNIIVAGLPDGVFLEEIRGKYRKYIDYNQKPGLVEVHFRQSRFAEIMRPINIAEVEAEMEEDLLVTDLQTKTYC